MGDMVNKMKNNIFTGLSGEKVLGLGSLCYYSFESDLNAFVTICGNVIIFWDLSTGKIRDTIYTDYTSSISLTISDNNKLIAIKTEFDHCLYIWDLETKKEIRKLEGHTDVIAGVIFLDDDKCILTSSNDCSIRLWDIDSEREIRKFTGHTDVIECMDITADEKIFASCSEDKTIRIWDIESGNLLETLEGHENCVVDISFSPDDRFIASCSWDGTVRIWNVETGMEIKCLRPNIGAPDWLMYLEDGKVLAVVCASYLVRFFDTDTFQDINPMGELPNILDRIFYDDNDNILITLIKNYDMSFNASPDSVKLPDFLKKQWFNIEIHHGDREAKPPVYSITHLITNKNDPDFLDIDNDPALYRENVGKKNLRLIGYYPQIEPRGSDIGIFDLATGKEIFHTSGYYASSNSVAFSPDGKLLATGYSDGNLRIRHAATGEIIQVLNGHYDNTYTKVAFSPDGRYIINRTDIENVCMREVSTGEKVREFPIDGEFDLQGGWIAAPEKNTKNICIWNILTGEKVRNLSFEEFSPGEAVLSPDKKNLAVFGYMNGNEAILFKDLETGEEMYLADEFVGEIIDLEAFSFSPDGNLFAFANPEKDMLLVRNFRENRSIYLDTDHDPIYTVIFSPDGKNIAYGGDNIHIVIRSLETGKMVKEFVGHTGIVETLAFSPDGKLLASSSWDGTVRLWEV